MPLRRSFFVAGTEVGLYVLLATLVPLYTRLRRESVLDHFVRGRVYEYIRQNPGEHYNSIRRKLGLKNGTLTYHLRTLELQAFIKAFRAGLCKRFYPVDMKVQSAVIQFSEFQTRLITIIKSTPGITQKTLIRCTAAPQQVVSYNLRALERARVIRKEKEGRVARYYIEEKEPIQNS